MIAAAIFGFKGFITDMEASAIIFAPFSPILIVVGPLSACTLIAI